MSSTDTVVVVGASLTAATAATTLREEGFDGRVVLIGDETDLPYERPPLSKGYLMGQSELAEAQVHPAEWYQEHDVELRLGTTVTAIDRDAHEAVLGDGEHLAWTHLLLATGATPRLLDVPGADLAGVHYLRRRVDSDALREAFARRAGSRVAVIGGGWIGMETVSAARAAGLEATVLVRGGLPLEHVLGPRVAEVFAGLHREHGVDLRTGVEVTALLPGEGEAAGRVAGVRLTDGSTVEADLVVVGIGAVPNVSLAEAAGLEVDDGVVVDEHLRTADPTIWAGGDVARAVHPRLGRRLRVDHWANAVRHGELAARSILGRDATDDRLPFFFTDQYDLGAEYVGDARPDDDVVFRGDVEGREVIAFWLREGRVVAGMNINVWDVTEQIEALAVSGRVIDVARLADPNVPLTDL